LFLVGPLRGIADLALITPAGGQAWCSPSEENPLKGAEDQHRHPPAHREHGKHSEAAQGLADFDRGLDDAMFLPLGHRSCPFVTRSQALAL
jgi:hypothetical protein